MVSSIQGPTAQAPAIMASEPSSQGAAQENSTPARSTSTSTADQSSPSLAVNGGSSAGLGIAQQSPEGGSHTRVQSRRASFQSKELSEMDLPAPSWLSQARGQRQLSVNAPDASAGRASSPQTADGLLTTTDPTTAGDSHAPMVASIPSSPFLGSYSPGLNSSAKFGDTAKYEELVARLEALNLPEPEILTSGSKKDEEEKDRILKEIQDVLTEMELPEPEYIQKYISRATGSKTPEPESQQPGEAMSPKVARATSIKRSNSKRAANGNGQAH